VSTIVTVVVLGLVCVFVLGILLCVFFGLLFMKKEGRKRKKKKKRDVVHEEMASGERQRPPRRRSKQLSPRQKSMNAAVNNMNQRENIYNSVPKMEELEEQRKGRREKGEGVYGAIHKVKEKTDDYGFGPLGGEEGDSEGVYEKIGRVEGTKDEYAFGSLEEVAEED